MFPDETRLSPEIFLSLASRIIYLLAFHLSGHAESRVIYETRRTRELRSERTASGTIVRTTRDKIEWGWLVCGWLISRLLRCRSELFAKMTFFYGLLVRFFREKRIRRLRSFVCVPTRYWIKLQLTRDKQLSNN